MEPLTKEEQRYLRHLLGRVIELTAAYETEENIKLAESIHRKLQGKQGQ